MFIEQHIQEPWRQAANIVNAINVVAKSGKEYRAPAPNRDAPLGIHTASNAANPTRRCFFLASLREFQEGDPDERISE
jgi:hypothetical protein